MFPAKRKRTSIGKKRTSNKTERISTHFEFKEETFPPEGKGPGESAYERIEQPLSLFGGGASVKKGSPLGSRGRKKGNYRYGAGQCQTYFLEKNFPSKPGSVPPQAAVIRGKKGKNMKGERRGGTTKPGGGKKSPSGKGESQRKRGRVRKGGKRGVNSY